MIILHKAASLKSLSHLSTKYPKPPNGAWAILSCEVPPDDEADGDLIRVAGIDLGRHSTASPLKLLSQHQKHHPDGSPAVIGRFEEFARDVIEWKGATIPALLGRWAWAPSDLGRQHQKLWDEGFLDSVSIGASIRERKPLPSGGYEIIRCELFEVSVVTIPANPGAISVKDHEDEDRVKKLTNFCREMAIRNGGSLWK